LHGRNRIDIRAPLQCLVDHFEIPEVPDVATADAMGFRKMVQRITMLEGELDPRGSGGGV
jgi:hypothetical protein